MGRVRLGPQGLAEHRHGAVDGGPREARAWVAGVFLGCVVFLVYGSLVPLNWTPQPFSAAWAAFWNLPGPGWRAEERLDVVVNLLLMVPQAFTLAYLLGAGRGPQRGWLRMLGAWLLLATLSVAIEFAQVFFPPRDPSWTDVTAQWVGSGIGLLLYAAAGRRFAALTAGLSLTQPAVLRRRRWLYVYLVLLLIFSMAPLDLSLSPGELYRKWRDGGVVLLPFSANVSGAGQFFYELVTDILLWVPVGLAWRFDQRTGSLGAILRKTFFFAAGIECAQVLVLSRVSDITDVLLALVGAALGARLLDHLGAGSAMSEARRGRWFAAGLGLWLVSTLLLLWSPFDFGLDHGPAARLAEVLARLPFETYFFRGEFAAFTEMSRKILVFLPGGLLLGAWSARGGRASSGWPLLGAVWAWALLLETGQLFLPDKVPDLTDFALGAAGAWLGWRVGRNLSGRVRRWQAAPGLSPGPVPATPPPPAAAPGPPALAFSLGRVLVGVGVLAVVVWVAARLPGLPYNIAKLVPPGVEGVLAACGVAVAAWWLVVAPMALLEPRRRTGLVLLPLCLLVHGSLAFLVLRASVPLPMLHKIVGSPVLGGTGFWEDYGRFLALHGCVVLPLLGAALLVRVVRQPRDIADLVLWFVYTLLLAWPLHWVVVEQAATDNLIELMRDRGSLPVTVALSAAWGALALAGSALSASLSAPPRLALLGLAVVAIALAPWLFMAGLEPLLIKYGQAFSALQFLVSAGRSDYAVGSELTARAAIAMGAVIAAVALLQASTWRALAISSRQQPVRTQPRRGLGGRLQSRVPPV